MILGAMGFLSLPLLYLNCGRSYDFKRTESPQVTSVGNPMDESARTLMANICRKLASCHTTLGRTQCEAGLASVAGVGEALGLPVGLGTTFSDMMGLEQTRTIRANSAEVMGCGAAVDGLSCSSSLIQGAFQPGQTGPLNGVVQLLQSQSASCSNSFDCPGGCVSPAPSAAPSATPSATLSPSPNPSPTASPGPSSAGYCVYWDEANLAVGQSYNCPQHGSPALTRFSRVDYRSPWAVAFFTDSGCMTPAGSGYMLFTSSSSQSGTVPASGTARGLDFQLDINLNDTYSCQSVGGTSGLYYKKETPTTAWSSATCVFWSDEEVCPP